MSDGDSLAMLIISQQLDLLDDSSKKRLVDWFQSKYIDAQEVTPHQPSLHLFEVPQTISDDMVIRNVAYVDDLGDFKEIIEDLKAVSVSDAAVRATYVLVYAYCELMDAEEASSRKVVVPFLKKYDLYSGSMRAALKKEADIDREGDMLSLTPRGVDKALDFIEEIQDPSVRGRWNLLPRRSRGAKEVI